MFELGLALKHAPFLSIFKKNIYTILLQIVCKNYYTGPSFEQQDDPDHLQKLPKRTVLLQQAGSGDDDPDHLQKLLFRTVLFARGRPDHLQKLLYWTVLLATGQQRR